MKKQNYTPPQITIIDLTEKINTLEEQTVSGKEGSAVMLNWLLG